MARHEQEKVHELMIFLASPQKVMSPYLGDQLFPSSFTDPRMIKCMKCQQIICHGPLIVQHERGEGSNLWEPVRRRECSLIVSNFSSDQRESR